MKKLLPLLLLLPSLARAQITGGDPPPLSASPTFTGLTVSSAAFVGVTVSTQAAGGAGASVTALCKVAGTFALGGGCSCAVVVAATSVISVPNVVTAGGIATGWTCQVAGGTGGQCSAYVICSRLQ